MSEQTLREQVARAICGIIGEDGEKWGVRQFEADAAIDLVLEEAAKAVVIAAEKAGKQECCGVPGTYAPECCGNPRLLIDLQVADAAIRALGGAS